MKTNKIIIIIIILLTSCNPLEKSNFDPDLVGITFIISNETNQEYINANITIGGMKDGEFIGTESYDFPTLKVIANKDNQQNIAVNVNRWNPNLDLIRNIPSERAYFKLRLKKDNELILRNFSDNNTLTNFVSRNIPKGYTFKNQDGELFIGIKENNIIARLYENN